MQTVRIAYELLKPQSCVVIYEESLCSEREWDDHVEFLRTILHHGNRLKFLIYTEHGSMPRGRQAQLNATMHGYSHRVAIVSASPVARFVASVFMLGNRQVSLFSPAQLKEACAHLGCDQHGCLAIETALERLRSRVRGNAQVQQPR